MRYGPRLILILGTALVIGTPGMAQDAQSAADGARERHLAGHSRFGEAFDEGPRERPVRMTGIGVSHFPITTSNPEAQMWFDQGHTLIHSFWYYEAERAFRWAAKLDPDAPMPYWGLVRATSGARARAFMKEASARKAKASPRERAYIEAWELQFVDGAQTTEGRRRFTRALEITLGSDRQWENARRFKSYDDFEEMGIHSTILIDKDGRVHWAQHGGAPFDDFKFLAAQLQRMNQRHAASRVTTTAR